ncbi:MAG: arsenite methyltransferase [Proteobacteria bacterium]|nr:arsenite methyltransferase [Pseudomonadota bacterium]MBU1582951.1 arsenite methyltransferase [Pseudomonadota bacterium]MBU2455081.1 arsenite methyltransferase [Pseudomonadota bacterium]MBU2630127.1 arsenite methyltransferase [Pseudomonadota bacterium]
MEQNDQQKIVREEYAKIAQNVSTSCCGSVKSNARAASIKVGYSEDELESIPDNANMGLGCGNPTALASISEGETVLDLGSGGGMDCFLAVQKVGPSGKVIGVDMTPEMVEKARQNAVKMGHANVEFRLGEIESLPVADSLVDVIISNCVINLSMCKDQVFQEAYRVLKKGGRIMISDVMLIGELPENVVKSVSAYVGCIAGAVKKEKYLQMIADAGFSDVRIIEETKIPAELWANDPMAEKIRKETGMTKGAGKSLFDSIASVKIFAQKK